jgi:hypothetical protein
MTICTLKEFKKNNPDLKGKKIILCEHIKDKLIDNVVINLWIGQDTRILLCPICTKVHAQTIWDAMTKSAIVILDSMKIKQQEEYGSWLVEAGKEKS